MEKLQEYTEYVNFPCHFARLEWIYHTIQQTRKANEPIKVLDIGCGTGNITIPLGLLPLSEIVGIDIHQGNIDISNNRNPFDNVIVKFESIFDCPIEHFDYIILTEVLEHISFYKEVLEYISTHAKKSMQLLLTVPNGYGPFEIAMQPLYLMRKIGLDKFIKKIKKIVGKKEPYSQNYDTPHVNFFTVSRLKKELRHYNMEVLQVKNAYVFSPIIETYLPFIPIKKFSRIDNKLAGLLPNFFASGHYYQIAIEKN